MRAFVGPSKAIGTVLGLHCFGSVPWPCSVRLVCPSCHSTDALGHVLFVWMDWGDCLVCHETSLWTDCLATAGVKHVLWVGGTFLELDRDKSRERFRPLGIRGSAQSLNDTGVAHFVEWCRCVYVLVHFVVSLCKVQGAPMQKRGRRRMCVYVCVWRDCVVKVEGTEVHMGVLHRSGWMQWVDV